MLWRKITLIVGGPVLIGLLFLFGHQHNLFYTTAWYDLLMHSLGGLLLIFTLAGTLWHLDMDPSAHPVLFKTGLIAALILASIGWEFLEVWLNMTPNWTLSIYDTVTDMLAALAGGLAALTFIRPGKQPSRPSLFPNQSI